ncbi:hypothetical protein BDN71DRAFT_560360 [Pleurotus eryngii]|uniref:Uncharacterized protein n=1 Tax=Pleurotus eryngii TaxID=5323 RepID=A0A9P6A1U0_PLEER|nr:hypothetical protein BDN71DRAFT_560360 [Pleurotus eryngii]
MMFTSVARRANWALRHGSRTWTHGRRGFKTVLTTARHEVTPPHRTSQGARLYSSTPRAEGAAEDSIQRNAVADQWLQALETAATAPWLDVLPADPADRLRRAYALLMQVVLYLHRPQNEIEQPLIDFMQAEAEPGSHIYRARQATIVLARAVIRDIASIPSTQPLHVDHPQIFALLGALTPLHDLYLAGHNSKDGKSLDLQEWTAFWERAQPILLDLASKLDEQGFGLDKEEWEKK